MGDFWSFLAAEGLIEKTLIVFLSDHGESLGEHGERTHGYFIYESTVRVPLIIHWPRGGGLFPSRVVDPAGLIDVAPTILQFLAAPEPPQFQGQSLMGLLGRGVRPAPREVYSESLYAHQHWECGTLRSLRVGDYKFINAPEPELYDLGADPAERNNLYARSQSLALAYRERMQQLRTRFASSSRAKPGAVSPEVARALSSLGYAAATASHVTDAESGPDPKQKLDEYLRAQDRNLPRLCRAIAAIGGNAEAGSGQRPRSDRHTKPFGTVRAEIRAVLKRRLGVSRKSWITIRTT